LEREAEGKAQNELMPHFEVLIIIRGFRLLTMCKNVSRGIHCPINSKANISAINAFFPHNSKQMFS
jgi:hypothetical protein